MSYPLGHRAGYAAGQAVFALDGWLRRRCGSFEYCHRPDCVFRIQRCAAPQDLRLRDGTLIRAGEPALRLHFWNEHMPRMAAGRPTLRWARQIERSVAGSLHELALYLACRADPSGIRVLFADMHLAGGRQMRQFRRIVARLGFEPAPEPPRSGPLRTLGETILVLLLVSASNPVGLRRAVRGYQSRVYLSAATLQSRYGRGREEFPGTPGWGTMPVAAGGFVRPRGSHPILLP